VPFLTRSGERLRGLKLEYNTVEHCNYGCRECSHFSPHMPVRHADLDGFTSDLAALERVYHVDRFRFVGGEPLLHPDLPAFIHAVRDSKIADSVEVVTNGSMLHKADDEVFRAIDFLSISWYADARCDERKIDLAREKCRANGTTLKVKRATEFRMMQLTQPIKDEGLLSDVYRSCQIAHSWYCQTFLDGYFYLCSRPLFTAAYLRQRGGDPPDLRRLDGVALHEPDLGVRLEAYLSRTEPLASCRHCLGTVGKRIEWQQMPLAERRSTEPLDRRAEASVSRGVLAYLLRWERAERRVLRALPSLRLARLLLVVKEATMRAVSDNTEKRHPRWLARRRVSLAAKFTSTH
jgi:cyclic pyranopterin phosphate synthase